MDDKDLARLEHENMIAGEQVLASMSAMSIVEHFYGVAVLAVGLPVKFFNQVIVERDDATNSAVEGAVALIRARHLPFIVNLRMGTDDRFAPLMAELGLVPVSEGPGVPGMALSPIPKDRLSELPGYEIVRVKDAARLEDHKRALTGGFEMPAQWADELLTPTVLKRDDVAFYTGYANDVPVTTGVGIRTGRTIGIYNIATLPEGRRHGYGEAMTRRVASDGALEGCDVAALQASPLGYPIYARLGYKTVVEYRAYVESEV